MKKPKKLLSSLALLTATALTALITSGCSNRCCDTNSCAPACPPACNNGYYNNGYYNGYNNGYYRRASSETSFSSKFQLNRKPDAFYEKASPCAAYSQQQGYYNNAPAGGSYRDQNNYQQSANSYSPSCNADTGICQQEPVDVSCQQPQVSQQYTCGPEQQTCAPCAAPTPVEQCAPAAAPVACLGDSVATIRTELVSITKRYPSKVDLGTEYLVELNVQGLENSSNVTITEIIPQGATLVRSQPNSAGGSGNQISWTLDSLRKGQTKVIRFWLKADSEGQLCGCTTVTCCPMVCVATFVGKACLECKKTGPARVNCDDFFEFMITVHNTGTAVAKNVVVTENLPAEVQHASGQRVLRFPLGDLQPKECRQIPVRVKALTRCVRVCNTITTTSANCEQKGCECCLDICKSIVKISKSGPSELYICKIAPYQINIQNEGDNVLHNVVVTDFAPQNTTIVKAPGANVSGNRAVWVVKCLNPGESKSFCISLTSQICGNYCNKATVRADDGCGDEAQCCTTWKGCQDLSACIHAEGPICLGATATYKLVVKNQGTAADKNVGVVFTFDDKLCPISGQGPCAGIVSGKTITFRPIATLGQKQTIEFVVKAKGIASGESRVKAEITAESLETPLHEEESTRVY